ncbi:MAG: hypothetical protein KGL39_41125 [Patescibacteria group bacterium]|nr:hypothetical protein [Patescibacteria group bacterium]
MKSQWESFVEKYKPMPNPRISKDDNTILRYLFDVDFPQDGETLRIAWDFDRSAIWTLCNHGGGQNYIYSGYRFADRLGYLITANPVTVEDIDKTFLA